MYKLTLFMFCLAFLAAAGGATGLGLALGTLTGVLGVLSLFMAAWAILSR